MCLLMLKALDMKNPTRKHVFGLINAENDINNGEKILKRYETYISRAEAN